VAPSTGTWIGIVQRSPEPAVGEENVACTSSILIFPHGTWGIWFGTIG